MSPATTHTPKSQYLQVRLDAHMKKDAESVLNELGITMTQAVKLFFKQVIMRKAIPFAVVIPDKERAFVSEREESMIEESLAQIAKGKKTTLDMTDEKEVAKHFGV